MNQIYAIHSDFYYVKTSEGTKECRLREILKKQKMQVSVGDFVKLEEGNVISAILPRCNSLKRPSVANLDKVVVVSALKEPALDFTQLNRYLAFFKYHKIPVTLCFNKEDLNEDECMQGEIEDIYKPLGYELLFTSALNKKGIDKFVESVKGKTTALCGQSGVGKTSILNAINPEFRLKIGEISQRQGRGTHTTRHCEIIEFDDVKIVDTPGFSQLSFDFMLPQELGEYFDEIKKYKKDCKFKNCLHDESQDESTCSVIKNIESINLSRYESYLAFLKETKAYKTRVTYGSTKIENATKSTGGAFRAKISSKKRAESRNTSNQKVKREMYD